MTTCPLKCENQSPSMITYLLLDSVGDENTSCLCLPDIAMDLTKMGNISLSDSMLSACCGSFSIATLLTGGVMLVVGQHCVSMALLSDREMGVSSGGQESEGMLAPPKWQKYISGL